VDIAPVVASIKTLRKSRMHEQTLQRHLLRTSILIGLGMACTVNAQQSSRTESLIYHHDTANWVLGQVSQRAVNGIVVEQAAYDAASALPTQTWRYGKPVHALTYHADGTLATVADGRGNTTALADWKRGVPRSITQADGTSQSAEVSDEGWITRITDENGTSTVYGYDGMGRLAGITYPAADTVDWLPTTQAFEQIGADEYGIPGGHWRQTVVTGNAVKIRYFDALWRPLLEREYDSNQPDETSRYIRFAYDGEGRPLFTSYPSAVADATIGTWTEYDALGRVGASSQDSEHGVLITTTGYGTDAAGPYTRVTKPDGTQTLTWYQAFEAPSFEAPVRVEAPEGEVTVISRDVFDKALSITRQDAAGTVSVTRTYVYNAQQELCKSIDPETSATVIGYDEAGNLTWSAAGLDFPDASACEGIAAQSSGRAVHRTYDARNRVIQLTFPDGNGDQTWSYTAAGQPETVVTNNALHGPVTNRYVYNKRRLLIGETLEYGAIGAWSMGYGYDSKGTLASLRYPSGQQLTLEPNGLRQPTRVGNHATAVSYHPNGAVRGFVYGNGIAHTIEQNVRGLPTRINDTGLLDLGMAYDAMGNVVGIVDAVEPDKSRQMRYDAANRLVEVSSAAFGGDGIFHYSYDVLDNLRTAKLAGVKQHNYWYDNRNRMTTVNQDDGAAIIGLDYDVQGNLAMKNGEAFSFDLGNRLRAAAGVETYSYDAHGRRVGRHNSEEGDIVSFYGNDGILRRQHDTRTNQEIEYLTLAGHLIAKTSGTAGSATCAAPAPLTESNAQTATCPAGTLTAAGVPTFAQSQSRITTYACPDPYGAPVASQSGWSDWTPAAETVCQPACVAPAPTEASITREVAADTRNVGCPEGQVGEHWQQQTRVELGTQTTTWSCPAVIGSPESSTSETWSGTYAATSDWTTTGNTCHTPAPPGPPAGTQLWECAFGSDSDYPFCRVEVMMSIVFPAGDASIDHWIVQAEFSEEAIINVPVQSCGSGQARAWAYVTYGTAECL
jgi:YD repeat-containing protein